MYIKKNPKQTLCYTSRASEVLKHPVFLLCSSLKDKFKAILKATYTHSRNLACFVFTYKGLQALQQKLQGKSLQSHSFLAACVGGWLVFGDNNNINSQVGQTAACGCQTSNLPVASVCVPIIQLFTFYSRSTCTCCPGSCSPCLGWL